MDISTREDVIRLVDTFYSRVMVDDLIGVFFTEVSPISMKEHMPIIYDFWETMLLGASSYSGNAMHKHYSMNGRKRMKPEHFERWLSTWEFTIDELFTGPKADEAKTRAKHIANLMSYNMNSL